MTSACSKACSQNCYGTWTCTARDVVHPARAVHPNNRPCCAVQDIAATEAEAAKARAGAAAGLKGVARLAREAEKAQKEAVKVEADLAERDREFKARARCPALLRSQDLTDGAMLDARLPRMASVKAILMISMPRP